MEDFVLDFRYTYIIQYTICWMHHTIHNIQYTICFVQNAIYDFQKLVRRVLEAPITIEQHEEPKSPKVCDIRPGASLCVDTPRGANLCGGRG